MSASNWLELMKDASASGGNFAPVPDGDYDLKVLEATAKTTSGAKPMYEIKAEIQSGPHAKRLVWDRLVISRESSGALRYFFRKMAALGLNDAFFAQGPTDAQITSALTGVSFRAKLGSREYLGKVSNEIKEYYPAVAGGPAFAPVPAPAAAAPAAAPAAPPAPPAPAAAPAYGAPAAPPAAPVFPPSQIGAPAAPPASPWETQAPPVPPTTDGLPTPF